MVYRIFVEKKEGLDNEARGLLAEARNLLGIDNLTAIRLFNRYDAENITEELFAEAVASVFSEPQLDIVTRELTLGEEDAVFAVAYLPGLRFAAGTGRSGYTVRNLPRIQGR
jgi:phosphoribosylformylglycinamidine synthase